MKTCSNCGAELENSMNFCPLCGEPMIHANTENTEYIKLRKREQEKKLMTDYQKLSGLQKRKLFWEISGILLISGMLITLIIDLLDGFTITWSKYTLAVCAVILINITLIVFWWKKIILWMAGSFVSTSALLVLLDLFNGNTGWGLKFGIPLLFAAYLIIFALIWLIWKTRERELNLITYSLLAAGLLCVCIEGLISLYSENTLALSWSLIVMASVLPVSSLLFYIQYRMKKGTDLKRFFHI